MNSNGECEEETINDLGKNRGKIVYEDSKMHDKDIRLYNYIGDSNVVVKAIYHSGDYFHCEERSINEIYSENVNSGQCFKFTLPLMEDIIVNAKRSDLGPNNVAYMICSRIVAPSNSKSGNYIP